MLPMLSFGQPVQLTVFYKQKAVMHESQRASLRSKAGVTLSLEIDSPYQRTDSVRVDEAGLRYALKVLRKSHKVEYVEQVSPEFPGVYVSSFLRIRPCEGSPNRDR